MSNKTVVSVVLGFMCMALTLGICIQIRTVKNSNSTVSQNYEENNLRAEVLKYKERYDNKYRQLEEAEAQLEKIRENVAENDAGLEEAENKIKKANKINGLSEVTGAGVIIKLEDGKKNPMVLNPSDLIVHDLDVLSVINELKNAGAEAISINDQRIVSTTAISCGGNIIDINGERVGAPFTIKAIGLPEYLAGLSRVGGYLELLQGYGIEAPLEKSNNITIPKYNGVINFKYMKNVK